jgi:hypothetical protein
MIAVTATRRGMTVPTSTKAVGLLNQQTVIAVMFAAGFDSTVRPTSALSRTIPVEITVLGAGISDNVSAVYEPPEPTARAAQEVPRPSRATPFIGCVAGARKRAVRNTQRVI